MPLNLPTTDLNPVPTWEGGIPEPEWAVYQRVIQEIKAANLRVAFGGAFATAVYTGVLRNTKDFDFYVLPEDREAVRDAISRTGLEDYFDRLPYDRSWIYRASRDDVIVDAIWAMANLRATVDDRWVSHGPEISIRGERLRAIPIEELIWSKLYVLQRERSDWGDVFNLIDARAEAIEWGHLIRRLQGDAPLLTGTLSVFAWLAPDRVSAIDPSVWGRLGLDPPEPNQDPAVSRARARLLDSRPWFRTGE
jgi:hypothetical protein